MNKYLKNIDEMIIKSLTFEKLVVTTMIESMGEFYNFTVTFSH